MQFPRMFEPAGPDRGERGPGPVVLKVPVLSRPSKRRGRRSRTEAVSRHRPRASLHG